jgi:hypothetical protein
VQVVHGDDGWEESDEAWELGEEEMMIIGTVQQEDDCSWQDACNSWMGQGEELAAGVYQVRACQEAAKWSSVGQCKKASTTGGDEKDPKPDDLLLEGEEQEYFLELLMGTVPSERPLASQPAKDKDDVKSKAVTVKSKEKKRSKKKEKKALEESKTVKEVSEQEKKGRTSGQASELGKQMAPDLADNPEAKGRGLTSGNHDKKEQVTGPQATSGGECSGQKTPDCP